MWSMKNIISCQRFQSFNTWMFSSKAGHRRHQIILIYVTFTKFIIIMLDQFNYGQRLASKGMTYWTLPSLIFVIISGRRIQEIRILDLLLIRCKNLINWASPSRLLCPHWSIGLTQVDYCVLIYDKLKPWVSFTYKWQWQIRLFSCITNKK